MARAQYLQLFDVIDRNKDGYIDMGELRAAFTQRGVQNAEEEAAIFFEKSDLDKNKLLDKDEFLLYMENHEREMQKAFTAIDKNKDNVIDTSEVIAAFKDLGINVTKDQVDVLIKRVDVDGNQVIDWDEWRTFLLFRSSTTIVSTDTI